MKNTIADHIASLFEVWFPLYIWQHIVAGLLLARSWQILVLDVAVASTVVPEWKNEVRWTRVLKVMGQVCFREKLDVPTF